MKDSHRKPIEYRNRLSPFNIDTPNRKQILENGLLNKHGKILGSGRFGTVYKAFYKGEILSFPVNKSLARYNALYVKHFCTLNVEQVIK